MASTTHVNTYFDDMCGSKTQCEQASALYFFQTENASAKSKVFVEFPQLFLRPKNAIVELALRHIRIHVGHRLLQYLDTVITREEQ